MSTKHPHRDSSYRIWLPKRNTDPNTVAESSKCPTFSSLLTQAEDIESKHRRGGFYYQMLIPVILIRTDWPRICYQGSSLSACCIRAFATSFASGTCLRSPLHNLKNCDSHRLPERSAAILERAAAPLFTSRAELQILAGSKWQRPFGFLHPCLHLNCTAGSGDGIRRCQNTLLYDHTIGRNWIMLRRMEFLGALLAVVVAVAAFSANAMAQTAGPATWQSDLTPITPTDWNYDFAAHLLERAGFGGTPEEIQTLARMTPAQAVARLVRFEGVPKPNLPPFEHSGIHDPGLEPFPPSRPAVTDMAKEKGEALGIKVKPTGNRRLQPVVDEFFYWLRASVLETNRVGYWWANRMVSSPRPLEEKMALFWHGHFASNEAKVRDYRKLLAQLEIFQKQGLGNFRDLTVAVAQSPSMLAFLDAGVNVKGASNENFAREIMELFTMGVGNYTENDIREAARAFTGWNYVNVNFVVNKDQHDDGEKTVLGKIGRFDGVDVIDIIMQQPCTADYIAGKIYRYFVREDLSPELQKQLGSRLRNSHYEIRPLLETIFLSRDFYSRASVGTQIKSPVQLAVSTYHKMGLANVPGVPDFNQATSVLGQQLFSPPTVAGWPNGQSWITPGLLLERANFARDILFPDISFLPPDRYTGGGEIRRVAERIRRGMDISMATSDETKGGEMAESNKNADRDEEFNTRYGSFRGSQLAIQRVKPIIRDTAQVNLSKIVLAENPQNTTEVVDYLIRRFMRVRPSDDVRRKLVAFLDKELGTSDIAAAQSYLDEPLRLVLHLIMSQPEFQLS